MQASERIVVLSELDAADPSFDVTDASVMRALHRAEDQHFWHRTRNELIADRLRALGAWPGTRVIELGCGGGCVTAHLARVGYEVVGVEGQRSLLELAAERAPSARFFLHDLRRGVDELPERDFEVAGLFDVIEHIDHPEQVLQQALGLVKSGGLVVGTVPALRALWSNIDEQSGHKTRYERRTLRAVLDQVQGARFEELIGFNRVLVPMLWAQRRWVRGRGDRARRAQANFAIPPWPVNEAMATALRVERRAAPVLERLRLGGASLWFALRRVE